MADVRPTKLQNDGNGYGSLREFADGDTVPVALGGTGAATAADARTSLGLGSAAVRAALGSTGALYSRDSILGSVSQSSGVPTGAVIQRGSNANGEFVRIADGTQVCYAAISLQYSANNLLSAMWSYPAGFSGAPVVICTPIQKVAADIAPVAFADLGACLVAAVGTSAASPRIFQRGTASFPSGAVMECHVVATGRWF
ncbi:phage tail protein [Pseudomonas aeruginosa]|uniref:phage tail protein n=1 Tax=Pseudomonas aeruginosa TaxID=287 RepID=UPI00117BA5B2|nr:phage tail protein [Pseudomonas aeruginosa]TRO73881.1 phage tail protein [Pseudomonas aeruginosa]